MSTWNELFAEGQLIARFPQHQVLRFVRYLESAYWERPLILWDLCCGAGRHTVELARRGHKVYASDGASSGVEHTRDLLWKHGLSASVAEADMTQCPWPEVRFHGIISWDALHHNRSAEIERAVSLVRGQLLPGGLFLATLKSTKADSFGLGRLLEPGTYLRDDGLEAGVPHHFFDEGEIRALLAGWEILVLVEQVMDYRVQTQDLFEANPFDYTRWCLLARKPK